MSAAPDRRRRGLLFGRASVGASQRPPWARIEAEFLEACSRCGDCLKACPEALISLGDGGFPRIAEQAGECTFCGDCAAACQHSAFDRTQTPPWPRQARLQLDRCLTVQGIVCASCREVCPQLAISFRPARPAFLPELDSNRCNGCGACAAICPSTAIELHSGAHT